MPLYLVKVMIRVVIVKKVGLGERQQRSAKALRGPSKFYLNREVKGATVLKLGRRGLVDLANGRVPYRSENKPINFRK